MQSLCCDYCFNRLEWQIFHNILVSEDIDGIISQFFMIVCWSGHFVYINVHVIKRRKKREKEVSFCSLVALVHKVLYLPLKSIIYRLMILHMYMARRGYKIYVWELKNISLVSAANKWNILLTPGGKIFFFILKHIFNFPFI